MKIEQRLWTTEEGWKITSPQSFVSAPQLVLVFGERKLVEDVTFFEEIKAFYPKSNIIIGSSGGGEIIGRRVRDHSLAVTALYFEKSALVFGETEISGIEDSRHAGERLANMLPSEGLKHVLVFSDGTQVNGSVFVEGLNESLPPGTSVTGGLMGDGVEFKYTALGLNTPGRSNMAVVVGFYGESLHVGYGSFGGWDAFGLDRTITKSKGPVLYEIDGKPALQLYKDYLGERASGLPITALYFPLRLRYGSENGEGDVIRTIFQVNEEEQSVTSFGDMPQGAQVTLMKANFGRLIDGAVSAGTESLKNFENEKPEFALLVSCVGRKMVLKDQTEEEVEAVSNLFCTDTFISGFYSYGEICPQSSKETSCLFHNQTMTITVFREL